MSKRDTDASDKPLYVSKPTLRSLWRKYRLFADRLELETVPWGKVVVPLSDIKAVTVRPAVVGFDLIRGDYGLAELMKTVKLDMADLGEHIAIEKTGFWKQFRITPDDPSAFKAAVDKALRERKREH